MSGVLEAHGIHVESITGELEGDVEKDRGPEWPLGRPTAAKIPLLTATRMHWQMVVPPGKREAAEKAARIGHRACSVFQSFERGIDVEPSWHIEEVD